MSITSWPVEERMETAQLTALLDLNALLAISKGKIKMLPLSAINRLSAKHDDKSTVTFPVDGYNHPLLTPISVL